VYKARLQSNEVMLEQIKARVERKQYDKMVGNFLNVGEPDD